MNSPFKNLKFAFAILMSTAFFACNESNEPDPVKKETVQPKFAKEGELFFLKPDGTVITGINIEIADNDAERQAGLMNRSFMANNQGMLFIFDKEELQGFWMKNTIIPLDILYVNSQFEIVSIAKNTQPFSEQSIPSGKPAKYVVEVNAGFCDQFNIVAGDKIRYTKF